MVSKKKEEEIIKPKFSLIFVWVKWTWMSFSIQVHFLSFFPQNYISSLILTSGLHTFWLKFWWDFSIAIVVLGQFSRKIFNILPIVTLFFKQNEWSLGRVTRICYFISLNIFFLWFTRQLLPHLIAYLCRHRVKHTIRSR